MEWIEVPFTPPERTSTRTPGLHLSNLIREIERDVLGDEARPEGEIPFGLAEAGFVWEGLCESWARRAKNGRGLVLQREVEDDGVFMTPDLYSPTEDAVYDFKFTWKSTSSIGEWQKRYLGPMIQLQSYCRYYGSNVGWLVFFFAMGNYKRGPEWDGPQARQFKFTWTTEELERNWAWVLRKRDEWNKRGGPKPYAKGAKKRGGAKTTVVTDDGFSF